MNGAAMCRSSGCGVRCCAPSTAHMARCLTTTMHGHVHTAAGNSLECIEAPTATAPTAVWRLFTVRHGPPAVSGSHRQPRKPEPQYALAGPARHVASRLRHSALPCGSAQPSVVLPLIGARADSDPRLLARRKSAAMIPGGWKAQRMPQNEKKKNPAAVTLGRLGGMARTKSMTARQRSELARHAVTTRWAKAKQAKAKRP
jgi:hypothetical protein